MTINTHCPFCGKTATITVADSDYYAWQNGALIQRTMPYLTSNEREMIKTGICPKCWDKMFAGEEDD